MEILRPFKNIELSRLDKVYKTISHTIFCVLSIQEDLWIDKSDLIQDLEDLKNDINNEIILKLKDNIKWND